MAEDEQDKQDVVPVDRRKRMAYLRNISKQRATNLLPGVWTYLGKLMGDETAPHGARLSASNMILDRALGKSTEHKEVDVRVDINAQHLDALKVINAAFRADAEAQVLEVLDGDVVEEDTDEQEMSEPEQQDGKLLIQHDKQDQTR